MVEPMRRLVEHAHFAKRVLMKKGEENHFLRNDVMQRFFLKGVIKLPGRQPQPQFRTRFVMGR